MDEKNRTTAAPMQDESQLQRKLKPRQMNMIAIGGAIGVRESAEIAGEGYFSRCSGFRGAVYRAGRMSLFPYITEFRQSGIYLAIYGILVAYIGLPIFIALFLIHKLVKKTRFVAPEEMNFRRE